MAHPHSERSNVGIAKPPVDGRADDVPTSNVLVRMRGMLPSLSGMERAVAHLILQAPDRLHDMTISALADAAGVSDTSVTRFSRSLGYRGYPDLRLAVCLADDRQRSEAFWVGADIAIDASDTMAQLAGKIAAAETQALRETSTQLDFATVDEVAGALSAARRVEVFAVGSSALVAADLEYKLRRLGIACFSSSDVHRALSGASQLSSADVAVAISHSGRTGETLDPLREAHRQGARTVAITHDPRSPIARASSHVLTTAGRETSVRTGATVSRMAQLFVVDCLYARLVQHLDPEARQAFDRADQVTKPRSRRAAPRDASKQRDQPSPPPHQARRRRTGALPSPQRGGR